LIDGKSQSRSWGDAFPNPAYRRAAGAAPIDDSLLDASGRSRRDQGRAEYWELCGWSVGGVAIAVPVGGVAGAVVGAVLGQISNPRLLVLLMAVFAGTAAGGVAGKVPWGEIGEIGGQVAGGVVGGIAWVTWFIMERRKDAMLEARVIRLDGQKRSGAA